MLLEQNIHRVWEQNPTSQNQKSLQRDGTHQTTQVSIPVKSLS